MLLRYMPYVELKQHACKVLYVLPLFGNLMSDFCYPSSATDSSLWVYVTIPDMECGV